MDLAKTYGYSSLINPNDATRVNLIDGKDFQFRVTSDVVPRIMEQNPTFMIVLDNINLESYDYGEAKESRQNILKMLYVAGELDSGVVNHMALDVLFIKTHNAYDVNLKNLRARILHSDYTPVDILSPAEITLYICEPHAMIKHKM